MAWFDERAPSGGAETIEFGLVEGAQASRYDFSRGAIADSEAYDEERDAALATCERDPDGEAAEPEPVGFSQQDVDEAWARGFESARAQFEHPRTAQLTPMERAQHAAMARVIERMSAWAIEAERDLASHTIDLARALAEQVLGAALERDEGEVMAEIVGQVVERAVELHHLRVIVRPEAVAPITERVDALRRRHPDHAPIEVIGDASLGPGDCDVRADGAAIQARMEARLDRMEEAAREALAKHEPGAGPDLEGAAHEASDAEQSVAEESEGWEDDDLATQTMGYDPDEEAGS